MAIARTDVTYCGDDGRRPKGLDLPPSPIQDTETADDVWIPIVTQAGMSIITRDKKLLTRPGELHAIAASRARVFTQGHIKFTGRGELVTPGGAPQNELARERPLSTGSRRAPFASK